MIQRFFEKLFDLVRKFDLFRRRNRWAAVAISGIASLICVWAMLSFLGLSGLSNPGWWPALLPKFFSASTVVQALTSIIMSVIFVTIFVGGLFPLLTYVPEAAALKALGVVRVSHTQHGWQKAVTSSARGHNKTEPVRIICIGGKFMFREEHLKTGQATPLHELACNSEYHLKVLLPRSSAKNPTILERWNSYPERWRNAHGISTIERYVDQIESGKVFLRSQENNEVFEHDELCRWRVVLFSNECIAQPYFPNFSKSWSYEAPALVFEKNSDDPAKSLYRFFDTLFNSLTEKRMETKDSGVQSAQDESDDSSDIVE